MPLKINLSPPKLARGLRMSPLAQRGGLSQVGGLVFFVVLCPLHALRIDSIFQEEREILILQNTHFLIRSLCPLILRRASKSHALRIPYFSRSFFQEEQRESGYHILLYRPAKQEGAEPTSEQAINQLTSKESCSFSSLNNESKDHF